MASHTVRKWMPFKIHKTVILHNTLWIYVCMRSSCCVASSRWPSDMHARVRISHFAWYHIAPEMEGILSFLTKTPTNHHDWVHFSGSRERAISLFMDPARCLSVTHRLRDRRHHLAPRVGFNDFPVKDVGVMSLLLFSQLSWKPWRENGARGFSGSQLDFDKNVNVM